MEYQAQPESECEWVTIKINPLVTNPAASVYSNIFLLLAILIMGVWMLYRVQFHASKTLVHKDEPFK
ncbi:hypothetical protein [Brevibacillus porteri]|uniref:hypothetical protein n=1 Tax=Brevibacillus porteri TaxID=2126350 RepID=UPI003D2217D0